MTARRSLFNHLVAPLAGGPLAPEQATQLLNNYRAEIQIGDAKIVRGAASGPHTDTGTVEFIAALLDSAAHDGHVRPASPPPATTGCACMPHQKFPCGHCPMDVCLDCDRCPCSCRCSEGEGEDA